MLFTKLYKQFGLVVMMLVIWTKFTLCQAHLVLRWVTVYAYIILVCYQSFQLTQPAAAVNNMRNEYWPRGNDRTL